MTTADFTLESGPTEVGLEMAVPAAGAQPPPGLHDDVADLARETAGPGADLAIENQGATDAGAQGQNEGVGSTGRGANRELGPGDRVDVVGERHGHHPTVGNAADESVADQIDQGDRLIEAGEIRGLQDSPGRGVDQAGAGDPDAGNVVEGAELLEESTDGVGHRGSRAGPGGAGLYPLEDPGVGRRPADGSDRRSAEVDSENIGGLGQSPSGLYRSSGLGGVGGLGSVGGLGGVGGLGSSGVLSLFGGFGGRGGRGSLLFFGHAEIPVDDQ